MEVTKSVIEKTSLYVSCIPSDLQSEGFLFIDPMFLQISESNISHLFLLI